MNKEALFKKTIVELVDLGRSQGNVIGKEQIEAILEPLDFDKEQKVLIEGYLKEQKIGIDTELSPEDFMTKEDIDYLNFYLDALKDLKEITGGKKEALLISAMAGDESAYNTVVEMYLPEVVEIAKLYVGEGAFIEDLIGEGNVALTIASKSLGCLESTGEADGFIGKMIMDAIEKHLESVESNDSDMKIILNKLDKMMELSKESMERIGRKITVEELISETDFTEEEIMEARILSEELNDAIGEIE